MVSCEQRKQPEGILFRLYCSLYVSLNAAVFMIALYTSLFLVS